MKRLPLEILKQIFILLPQQQKVECMCVCRAWENLIRTTCLFHTILLTSQENLDNLTTVLEHTPSKGTQVERLIFYTELGCDHLLHFFPTLFPNMKYFYRFAKTPSSIHQSGGPPVEWNSNRVEALYESPFDTLSYRLLLSSQCKHLKTLYLNVFNLDYKDLVPAFLHAPNLVNITLLNHEIKLDEMEKLHEILPKLEKAKFSISTPKDTELPKDIVVPNTLMKCVDFRISHGGILEQCKLLKYIGMKYTHLTSFVYDPGELHYEDPMTYLFDNDQHYTNDEPVSELAKALVDVVAGLGSQLKRLKVICDHLDPILLIRINPSFKLTELDVGLGYIESLKMKKFFLMPSYIHLQSLTLQCLDTDTFKWLKVLTGLETLKIKYPQFPDLRLDAIMRYTNNLQTLVLEDFSIKVNPKQDCIYPLKNLKLKLMTISKNLDLFLSRTCPELKTLALFNCTFTKHSFRLPQTKLLLFKLIKKEFSGEFIFNENSDDENYILVKTRKETKMYFVGHRQPTDMGLKFFDPFDLPAIPRSRSFPYDTLSRKPHMTFQFDSVQLIDTATKWKRSQWYLY